MKFAHMADVHIGSFRDPKLKDLATDAFIKAIKICIDKHVDFIIIAGDLFNTALPGIDNLKSVVKEFKVLHELNIPVYVVPGSHDYSPSGKTMIDVLEEAGLLHNVFKGKVINNKLQLKFTIDKKTGVKLTGILGRRGTLEKLFYQDLDLEHLEKESGFKIFLFHTSITELKSSNKAMMDSTDVSYLPKEFDYYAGGHVHIIKEYSFKDHKNIVYPGPLFPANFEELEELSNGGFYIYDNGKIEREEIIIKEVFRISVDCEHKTPQEVNELIFSKVSGKELNNTIVLLRIFGKLKIGKVSDINFKEIFSKCYNQGAFFVMRNTVKVISSEYEEINISQSTPEDVENLIIKENLGQIKVSNFDIDKEARITTSLMDILSSEKHEGEKVSEYEDRVAREVNNILEL